MPADQEPKVTRSTIVVKDFWKRWRTARKVVVSSGPLPTEKELSSKDGTGQETRVEGAPQSSAFPGTPRRDVPTKGARIDD